MCGSHMVGVALMMRKRQEEMASERDVGLLPLLRKLGLEVETEVAALDGEEEIGKQRAPGRRVARMMMILLGGWGGGEVV